MSDSNMQYVTSTSFLLLTYAKYLTISKQVVTCGGVTVTPQKLRAVAKRQVHIPEPLSYFDIAYNFRYSRPVITMQTVSFVIIYAG